jgi:hypothetical protein
MKNVTNIVVRTSVAAVAAFVGLFWNGDIPQNSQSTLVPAAHAIIGRPLTPMSYAGVARRTTARAVVAAPVYGAAVVAAPVVVAPAVACAQVVNAYGQIVRVCR